MRRRWSAVAGAGLLVLAMGACSADPAPEPEGGVASGELDRIEGTLVHPDSAALSPDGSRLAVPCDGSICVWDTAGGDLVDTWDGGSVVAWSPGGRLLATDDVEGETVSVVLLDDATGAEKQVFPAFGTDVVQDQPGGGVLDLAFSPQGDTLAGVGPDGTVRAWPVNDPGKGLEMALAGQKPVAVAFSPDGSRLAVASADAPVTLHDPATGKQVATLDGEPQGAVAWSEDGASLATASFALDDNAETTIWDAVALTPLARLARAGDEIAFASSSGRLALSVKNETDVLVWDWADDDVSILTGATDAPRAVFWAPDDATLYAVSARDTVLAWDPTGGEPTRFDKP